VLAPAAGAGQLDPTFGSDGKVTTDFGHADDSAHAGLDGAFVASADAMNIGKLARWWWFNATLAESYIGLGDFEQAIASLRKFNVAYFTASVMPPWLVLLPDLITTSTAPAAISVGTLALICITPATMYGAAP
jgi:hypothetical protein